MTKSAAKQLIQGGVIAAALGFSGVTLAATIAETDTTTVTAGGYVKFDFMMSDYSDGPQPLAAFGRDFYVPSLTPVGGQSEDWKADFHARQSRFNIGTTSKIDGHSLRTFIELDFMTHNDGNERVSNSYSPRIRHAFVTYDNWLFGQTWTTFQNTGALPDTVDFIGNTDFGIFVRQAQIRYTAGSWQFAVENPETTLTPNGGGGLIVTDDNTAPDFVARYNLNSGGLNIAFAGLVRQLQYDNGAGIDDTQTAVGVSVSGKYTFGNSDDIRFGINGGQGMGRYIGLNVAAGGVIDDNGGIEAIDSSAAYFAYRHVWSAKSRSTIMYNKINIDNDTAFTGTGVTAWSDSFRVNYFYSPVKNFDLGFEIARANREIESGADGNMTRLQFGAKLSF
jgi:hypothetical protein